MKKITTLAMIALLAFAANLWAQEPPRPGGDAEEFDIEAALRKVTELLENSEDVLVRTLRKQATPEEAAEGAEKAREAIDELLRQGEKSGVEAAELMMKILENAPPSGSGGGGGQESESKEKQEKEKRKGEEERAEDRDPGNSGDPKRGDEEGSQPRAKAKNPPESETEKRKPDPEQDWLPDLPEKMRQDYLNGDWQKIPQPWRKIIEDYHKSLSESESRGR